MRASMETAPIWGCACIVTVERRCGCWYVADITRQPTMSTLAKMHAFLEQHVAALGDPEDAPLQWKEAAEPTP